MLRAEKERKEIVKRMMINGSGAPKWDVKLKIRLDVFFHGHFRQRASTFLPSFHLFAAIPRVSDARRRAVVGSSLVFDSRIVEKGHRFSLADLEVVLIAARRDVGRRFGGAEAGIGVAPHLRELRNEHLVENHFLITRLVAEGLVEDVERRRPLEI